MRCLLLALSLNCLMGFLGVPVSGQSTLQLTVFNTSFTDQWHARCISGSPGGYYYAKGSSVNASKLAIFINGGGECRTTADCLAWHGNPSSDSSDWPVTQVHLPFVLSDDPKINGDFYDWTKLLIPYCSGDMHSGQQHTAVPLPDATGTANAQETFWFCGHNLIAATLAHVQDQPGFPQPSFVIVTGSSAGGIATIQQTDYVQATFPNATVKGAPQCGFFYPGVTSMPDYLHNTTTPAQSLGFIPAWAPFVHEDCRRATGDNMSACTDAHFLLPYLKSPQFFIENQYDSAKLANCGLFFPESEADMTYLRAWGHWMRSQFSDRQSKHGIFAPSCYDHGSNLDFRAIPDIAGVTLGSALSDFCFGSGSLRHNIDQCGDLPCTIATDQQQCTHIAPLKPLPQDCQTALETDCPGLQNQGQACVNCVHQHAHDLIQHNCGPEAAPVLKFYCGASPGKGHHVCDVSV